MFTLQFLYPSGKSLVSPGICSPSRLKVPSSFSLEPKGMRQTMFLSDDVTTTTLQDIQSTRTTFFFSGKSFGEMRCQMNCKPYVLNRNVSLNYFVRSKVESRIKSVPFFWWFPTSHFSVSACKLWKTTKTFSVYKKSNRRTGHLHVQRWPPFCRQQTPSTKDWNII